jgi:hypothetical protein
MMTWTGGAPLGGGGHRADGALAGAARGASSSASEDAALDPDASPRAALSRWLSSHAAAFASSARAGAEEEARGAARRDGPACPTKRRSSRSESLSAAPVPVSRFAVSTARRTAAPFPLCLALFIAATAFLTRRCRHPMPTPSGGVTCHVRGRRTKCEGEVLRSDS